MDVDLDPVNLVKNVMWTLENAVFLPVKEMIPVPLEPTVMKLKNVQQDVE